jgi:hypothetical protein
MGHYNLVGSTGMTIDAAGVQLLESKSLLFPRHTSIVLGYTMCRKAFSQNPITYEQEGE